jgi:hypothetical protein
MNTNFDQVLAPDFQSALADEIVATVAAVVSNTSAPDSAVRALQKSRQESLSVEQRAAAAALQAYGARCASDVFTASLEAQAGERAAELQQALEADSEGDALASLESTPETGTGFKSRMSFAIAAKCAELVAAEIERIKTGPVTILNEEDAKVFTSQHEQHQQQRMDAAISFLSMLPTRFPTFGGELFSTIRHDVQRQIEKNHRRPDIHAAVTKLFDDAFAAMPAEVRAKVTTAH